jgi:YD repeat-containing protein
VSVAVDALGVPTLHTYAGGDLGQTAYANGLIVLDQYDPIFHHLTFESNDEGETTSNTYDPSTGDLLSSTDALGNTTVYAWSAGMLQSMTDPGGDMTRYLYDADRRLSATIDPLDNWTVQTYPESGNGTDLSRKISGGSWLRQVHGAGHVGRHGGAPHGKAARAAGRPIRPWGRTFRRRRLYGTTCYAPISYA